MRFESPGILKILGALMPLVAYVLFVRYVGSGWDFEELVYQFHRIDWVYVSFFAVPVAILIGVPIWRLFREYRIWRLLHRPFRLIEDPFIDVDLTEESYGNVMLSNGHTVKRAATYASASGVIVRKAAYPKLFPTFEIAWDQVSNIYFAANAGDEERDSDMLGFARVTLAFAEEFILVLPWRERFNQFMPDHIGFQSETVALD